MPTFLTSNLRRAYFRSWEHFNLGLHLDVEGIAEKVIERFCWGGESIVNLPTLWKYRTSVTAKVTRYRALNLASQKKSLDVRILGRLAGNTRSTFQSPITNVEIMSDSSMFHKSISRRRFCFTNGAGKFQIEMALNVSINLALALQSLFTQWAKEGLGFFLSVECLDVMVEHISSPPPQLILSLSQPKMNHDFRENSSFVTCTW